VLGLVGGIGSGKSTLAQLLCGLLKPDSGKIIFTSDKSRAVMTFQQPERQFYCNTVFEEIAVGLEGKQLSDKEIATRVAAALRGVGLDPDTFSDKDPHALSGGEARRLGLAIVDALDGDLVILDEPTCGLDAEGVAVCKSFVRDMAEREKAVVLISHNSDILADTADRIAVLGGGMIIADNPALAFFAHKLYERFMSAPDTVQYQVSKGLPVTAIRSDEIFST
jgi:energy-coupling factor transporter ATP-binding protein EcfA2